ncbi:MAG: gamma-glutamyl-gamma-aminobutyrate hydrolase family protein [Calditrichota bacterium]
MKPVIGISINVSPPDDNRRTLSKGVELQYLQRHYLDWIVIGGGSPVILPILKKTDDAAGLISRLDGLVLIGGVDVDPSLYGEDNSHSQGCDIIRDQMELALIREARRQSKAIICICRGLQVLNVAFEGSLYQDISTQIDGAQKHHRGADEPEVYHQVLLTRRSILCDLFDSEEIRVNSSHHQAINAVGKGLTVIAAAQDGVLEAVECPDDRCTIAVQWHPERMPEDPNQIRLAEWFVAQAV